MRTISPADLVCLNDLTATHPIAIDLVYADANHPRNIFKKAIYKPGAKFWLHRDLAGIVLRASQKLNAQFGYILELKDGLRTVEAQEAIWATDIMKAHPEWADLHLFARPGGGGHPRGMAVDVGVRDKNGNEIDMGVPFDYFSDDPAINPAARDFTGFPETILQNRRDLETAFVQAADERGLPLYPLPSEWWDFRFPKDIVTACAPIYDVDLPDDMKMTA